MIVVHDYADKGLGHSHQRFRVGGEVQIGRPHNFRYLPTVTRIAISLRLAGGKWLAGGKEPACESDAGIVVA